MLVENFEGADHDARERYLREHAEELYAALTDDYATALRLDELVYRAAECVPGLVPTRAEVDAALEEATIREAEEAARAAAVAAAAAKPPRNRAGPRIAGSRRRR